jgi:hypothetical protein
MEGYYMLKHSIKKIAKVLLSFVLLINLVFPTELALQEAKAAAKPSIESKMTIGIGTLESQYNGYFKTDYYTLNVMNPVKKATYSFTSSDTKVVTVKASGTKVKLTGVKAGTATITCKQKLKGKTTKVGTCKVTVKNASADADAVYDLTVGTYTDYFIYWSNRNCNATYTYTSDSKDFTMTDEVKKDEYTNNFYYYLQTYTAKKAGTYTVTVKETYNKKTRTVGKLKFTIVAASVIDTNEMYTGDTSSAFGLINNCRSDVNYGFYSEDDTIVDLYNEDGTVYIKALKPGTTTVKIYEDVTVESQSGTYIGTCTITVKELKVEDISCYFDDNETYVGGSSIEFEVYKIPGNAPGEITITSSDPKVVTVGPLDEYDCGVITPVGAGTATITITCGDITKTETITVYKDEDEMYGW